MHRSDHPTGRARDACCPELRFRSPWPWVPSLRDFRGLARMHDQHVGDDAGVPNRHHPRSGAVRGYRGSTRACPAGAWDWIPAFAGMTSRVDAGVANRRHPRSGAVRGYRGSTRACPAGAWDWIPAFAGMTDGVRVGGPRLASRPVADLRTTVFCAAIARCHPGRARREPGPRAACRARCFLSLMFRFTAPAKRTPAPHKRRPPASSARR